jgi:hypothetical protein
MRAWVDRAAIELLGAGLDESPDCYKRLDEVLESVGDTVRILHRHTPVLTTDTEADHRPFTSPVIGRPLHAFPAQQDYLDLPAGAWLRVQRSGSHRHALYGRSGRGRHGQSGTTGSGQAEQAGQRRLAYVPSHLPIVLDDPGAPMGLQQKLMRHADITTTGKYDDALMEIQAQAQFDGGSLGFGERIIRGEPWQPGTGALKALRPVLSS